MKDQARARTESMRAERAAQAARQKRNQRMFAIGGGVVILGLLIAIVLAVVNASGGGNGGRDTKADGRVVVPANVVDGVIPVGEEEAPVTVDLYYDYMCPACGAFEASNADDLTSLIEAGTVKVNLRMMNFLDAQSNGTQYSTRAGNALATVANDAPEAVWDLHNALYANQPAEGTEGLSDEEIASIATSVGVPADVADSFTDGTYRGWVAQSNQAAAEAGVNSTPTVKIDGETFEGNWAEPGVLAAAVEAAAE
ncbi:disulfide bond formation protein DsbA [Nocardioides seonyuensis]|uniref:Disulfide bond formation protein DsbA n=1 Tax=Nocardioides seonyuensis TaxID=2518371 RepID=A0A4P7IIL1_9ACTN|nr:thioredoxin domain-containing protein [Nocardioides seonyuensis]QBX57259.1 disulfide bond formation protein DsbA [Nocardioides seonyuensis]